MSLPAFNEAGDLPVGIYEATWEEVKARFGSETLQRVSVTEKLLRVYQLAQSTGKLDRVIIFGSYITSKPAPNDVDVVLIMKDDFQIESCDAETHKLFDHREAQKQLGASVFWVRPGMLILESLEEFIAHWQIKRDKNRRGIVEVKP